MIKTQDLTGAALDWAVLETFRSTWQAGQWRGGIATFGPLFGKGYKYPCWGSRKYSPSLDWKDGGPIIERERIMVAPAGFDNGYGEKWNATWTGAWPVLHDNWNNQTGPTPLIAAMRCYVASKLGDEVDVPEEFL